MAVQPTTDGGSDIRPTPSATDRVVRLEGLLASSPRSLRLPATLESAFRVHYLEEGISRLRFGMLTGIVLFTAFGFWDVSTFPPQVLRWSLAIRFGVACPLMSIVLVATYRAWSPSSLDRLRLAMAFGLGASVVAITSLAVSGGVDAQPHGLFLITVAAYTITGMRTPQAVLSGLAVLAMQVTSDLLTQRTAAQMVEPAVFILSANALGYATVSSQERGARTSFLRMKLLECYAEQDGLTGIANRRSFDLMLEHAFQAATREKAGLAIALFDVDCFKAYNDRLGHLAGDDCLRRIARAAESLARRPMDIAARIGGEEFAVLWYGAPTQGAERLAAEIRSAVEALEIERPDAAPRHRVSVSVGAVHVQPDGSDPLDALADADEALYEAKRAGRDREVVRILDAG